MPSLLKLDCAESLLPSYRNGTGANQSFYAVPLFAPSILPVLELQLPRVCPPAHDGCLPRAPEGIRGPTDTGVDPGWTTELADDEGQ